MVLVAAAALALWATLLLAIIEGVAFAWRLF
jgi:hypothetical protein